MWGKLWIYTVISVILRWDKCGVITLKSEVETLSELKENLSDIVSMLKDKKESKKAVG